MKTLISGTSSGLGKYLKETLCADSYNRQELTAPEPEYDVIIHCAFNVTSTLSSSRITEYVNDTINLTEWLLSIPHKLFVFISTTAVYPASEEVYSEASEFDAASLTSPYATMKLLCEGIVNTRSPQPLILRPTFMLGKDIRENTVLTALQDSNPVLPFSAASELNYILHEDVGHFIQQAWQGQLSGVYNLAAAENITLGEAVNHCRKIAQFGQEIFRINKISSEKASSVCPVFRNTSLDNLTRFQAIMFNG